MKNLSLLMCTAFCGLHTAQADAADNKKNERPNILWLTFEDTSAYEFGCYGNKDVHTPNADSLAARSLRVLLLDLRNGCPSGSIRHPGKHLLPAMAA